MDYCYSSHGIELHQTCGACPEQYDAYKDGVQCGYLRLRHGYFSVETTDHERRLVYEANPEGDGIFLYDERDGYLNIACRLLSEQSEDNYKKKYEEVVGVLSHLYDYVRFSVALREDFVKNIKRILKEGEALE